MQSYIDLSLLSIIGITVVVLILILISFLISYRHATVLENQIDNLKKALEHTREQLKNQQDQFAELERREMQFKSKQAFFNERCDTQERAQQLLSDRIQELQDKLNSFSLRMDQQQREIVENNAKTQPIFEATRMLRRGATMEEVVKKTGLMRHEIEMLTAVHGLTAQANDQQPPSNLTPGPTNAEVLDKQEAQPEQQQEEAALKLAANQPAEDTAVAVHPEQAEPVMQETVPAVEQPIEEPVQAESLPERELDDDLVVIPSLNQPEDQVELKIEPEPFTAVEQKEPEPEHPEPSFTPLGNNAEDPAFVLEREADEIREKLAHPQQTLSEVSTEAAESAAAPAAEVPVVTPERVISSGHTASLRARSAYGIPERRPSLRRQR
ncbi:MAG: hypothetical protein K6F05_04020 [Succinivibrio sp.]|nr:hypothetical protein [Succinivibrio sp.]